MNLCRQTPSAERIRYAWLCTKVYLPVGGAEGVYEAGQNLAHTGHSSDEGVVHL